MNGSARSSARYGALPEALASYRASLALIEGLANVNPDNRDLQRHRAIAHINVGRVLYAQGEFAQALSNFRSAFAIDGAPDQSGPAQCGLAKPAVDHP